MSGVPETREEMLERMAEVARLAEIKGHYAVARQSLRDIAELKGFLEAPPPVTEEKIDPEAYRERICKVARRYGMVHRDEVK